MVIALSWTPTPWRIVRLMHIVFIAGKVTSYISGNARGIVWNKISSTLRTVNLLVLAVRDVNFCTGRGKVRVS